jgi:ribosome-associated protein
MQPPLMSAEPDGPPGDGPPDATPPSAPPTIPSSDEDLLAQCRVETFRSGGKGGQHQNKTESGVRLVHLPTGVRATSRSERSQHRNKAMALERLRRKLQRMTERAAPRIETTVPKNEKRRRLEEKRKRSKVKSLRKPPAIED